MQVGVVWTFFLSSIISLLSPSLWETARYRLKYSLKGPLNQKQPTNQLFNYQKQTTKFSSANFEKKIKSRLFQDSIANSVGLDEVAHYEPPHQDLPCLQIQLFSSLALKELMNHKQHCFNAQTHINDMTEPRSNPRAKSKPVHNIPMGRKVAIGRK